MIGGNEVMVKITINGLKREEHMFQESIIQEATATAEKLERMVKFSPEDELHMQVKSHVEGKKKRFEVKARLTLQGSVYTAGEPDADYHRNAWDLHLAVKEALTELRKLVEKRAVYKRVKGLTEDEALEKRGGPNV